MARSLLVRAFEKATGTHAPERTAAAVSRFGPYLAGMVVAKGLSTGGQLLLSRRLGPEEVGHLAVVLSTSTLLALPVASAWSSTFVRYAAGQGEATWLGLLRWMSTRALSVTALLAFAVILLSPVLAPLLRVTTSLLIAGAALAIGMALWLVSKAACQGREDWRRFVFSELAFGGALALGALTMLSSAQWWKAMVVFLAAYLLGSLPAWTLFRTTTRSVDASAPAPSLARTDAASDYVRFALLIGVANTIFLYSDRFAVQRVLGFTEVGIYQVYNFATIGVAMLLSTMLYNFVFPLFPQGDRRAFASLFRSGFLRLLPLTLAALFCGGWLQIYLAGFPFRPGLLAIATLSAAGFVMMGFYGHLIASVGVSGAQLSAKVAVSTLALFALGVVPAVRLGGLNGLFALYTVIYVAVAVFYDQALRHLASEPSATPVIASQSR